MHHINNKDKKITYGIIAFILLITLINTLAYTRFNYPFGGDQALPNFNFKLIQYSFYIWNPSNFSGFYNPSLTTPLGLLLGVFFSLIQSIGGILFASLFYLWFYYSIGAVGMFLLIKDLALKDRDIPTNLAYVGGMVGAMLFSLHFDYHLMAYGIPAYFIPIFLLFFERLLYSDRISYEYLALSIVMFSLVLAIGPAYMIQDIIFFLVFTVPMAILIEGKQIRNLIYTGIIFLAAMLMLVPTIFSSYYLKYAVPSAYGSIVSTISILSLKNEILLPLLSFGPSWQLVIGFMPLQYRTALMGILLGILIVSFSTIFFLKRNNKVLAFIIPNFLEIIAFVVLGVGFNKPFGTALKALAGYVPEIVVFRYSFFATHFVFLFAFSFLFGYGFIKLLSAQKKAIYFDIILVVLLFVLASYLYLVDYLPIASGSYSIGGIPPRTVSNSVNLPSHVLLISNYINSQVGKYNVGLLPMPGFWELSNYYDGIDVYTSLVTHPVFTGGTSAQNEFFAVGSQQIYSALGYIMDNSDLNQSHINISRAFGVLGIKYIVVQGNTINEVFGPYSEGRFNLSRLYENLNISKGLILLKRYGNSSIFENIDYLPLVYASNIYNVGNVPISQIISSMWSNQLTNEETSIYSTQSFGLYTSNGTINASPINIFLKPKVAFVEDNPTQITVHVSNAATPYYLVFRETYDPHWAAFYPNGTEINPRDHIAVNGFANAWYMNKTGNYTVTLYYTLQTDAWIAWGVSFAALFVTIGIGIYGWKEMKKEKMRSRR